MINPYYIRTLLTQALLLSFSDIRKISEGGDITTEGAAFGDSDSDIETICDTLLGTYLLDFFWDKAAEAGIGYISVEGLQDVKVGEGPLWICIDPLDGSLNYRLKNSTLGLPFSTCITIVDVPDPSKPACFHQITAGGVIDLRSGDIWTAVRNEHGIFETQVNRKPSRVLRETKLDLGRNVVIAEFFYPENRERVVRALAGKKGWLRNPGSAAYEMALVSSGQALAYMCDRQKQHELGAAYALVLGAGGFVVDWHGKSLDNKVFDFNSQTPVILAPNPVIAARLLELVDIHHSSE